MTQSNCKLAIKLDNNPNAIYTPGSTISGEIIRRIFNSSLALKLCLTIDPFHILGRVIFTLSAKAELRGKSTFMSTQGLY